MDFKIEKNVNLPERVTGDASTNGVTSWPSVKRQDDGGSIPSLGANSPVAQRTEQEISNLVVGGSIPLGAAKRGRPRKCLSNCEHTDGDKCHKCGDKIPCESECIHYECLQALGKPLPDWIREVTPIVPEHNLESV